MQGFFLSVADVEALTVTLVHPFTLFEIGSIHRVERRDVAIGGKTGQIAKNIGSAVILAE